MFSFIPFHLDLSSIFALIFTFIFSLLFHLVSSFSFIFSRFFILSLLLSCFSLLFHLLLSCLVSPLSSSPAFLSLSVSVSLSLSLCLRVMLCVVLCGVCRCGRGVVGGRGVCLVCVCVLRHAEQTWKNPCVDSKTSPCVHSKRPRVYGHHAHMCFNMCAWCQYTRGRFERTHGDVFNGHTESRGSSPVLLTKICPRKVITWPRGSQKKPLDLTHLSLRTGRTRHVPHSSDHSLYLITLLNSSSLEEHSGRNQPQDGSICLSPPKPKFLRTICTTFHNGFMFFANISYKYFRVIVNRQRHHNIRNGNMWAKKGHSTSTCTATLCVIELSTHRKFESFKKKNPQRRKSHSNLLINSNNPEIVRIGLGPSGNWNIPWNQPTTFHPSRIAAILQ